MGGGERRGRRIEAGGRTRVRSRTTSKSLMRTSWMASSSGRSLKAARRMRSIAGGAAARTAALSARCFSMHSTKSAKARLGRWGIAASGSDRMPHTKARSMLIASLRPLKAIIVVFRGDSSAAAPPSGSRELLSMSSSKSSTEAMTFV